MNTRTAWIAMLFGVAATAMSSGCGGGSNPNDPAVVDLSDPAFSGPSGGSSSPAPAESAPPARRQDQAGGGEAASSRPGLDLSSGRGAQPGAEDQGGGADAAADAGDDRPDFGGGDSGPGVGDDSALQSMLMASNSANQARSGSDEDASAGRSGGAGGQGAGGQYDGYGGEGHDGYGGYGGEGDETGDGTPQMQTISRGGGMEDMPGYGSSEYEEEYDDYGGSGDEMMGMADGGYGGEFGEAGGFGGGATGRGPGATEPGDFSSPQAGAESFLNAAVARNMEGLREATALRAPQEAESKKRRDLFQLILQEALSQEELEAIGDDLEGYKIAGLNQVRSSGTRGFVLAKQGENGSRLQRGIYVRKEAAGWKVKDVTGVKEIKQIGGRVRNRDRRGNN